jgi:hypothetical protein
MGEIRDELKIVVQRPEGKRPLSRPIRRLEVIIKTDLREIGFEVWIRFTWLTIGTSGGLL